MAYKLKNGKGFRIPLRYIFNFISLIIFGLIFYLIFF